MPRKNNPDQDDMDNFHFDDGENEKSDEELLDEWNTEGEDDEPGRPAPDDEGADAAAEQDEDDGDWDDEDDEDDEDWDEDAENASEDGDESEDDED